MTPSQAAVDHLRDVTGASDVRERVRARAARHVMDGGDFSSRANLTRAQRYVSDLGGPSAGQVLSRSLKTTAMFELGGYKPPSLARFFTGQADLFGGQTIGPTVRSAVQDAVGPLTVSPKRARAGLGNIPTGSLVSQKVARSLDLFGGDRMQDMARPFITPRIAGTWRHDLVGRQERSRLRAAFPVGEMAKARRSLEALTAPTGPLAGDYLTSRTKGFRLLESHIKGISNMTGTDWAARTHVAANLSSPRPDIGATFAARLGGVRMDMGSSLAASLAGPTIGAAGAHVALKRAFRDFGFGQPLRPRVDYSQFVGPTVLPPDRLRDIFAGIAGVAREYQAEEVAEAADYLVSEVDGAQPATDSQRSRFSWLVSLPLETQLNILLPLLGSLDLMAQWLMVVGTNEEMPLEYTLGVQGLLKMAEMLLVVWVVRSKSDD